MTGSPVIAELGVLWVALSVPGSPVVKLLWLRTSDIVSREKMSDAAPAPPADAATGDPPTKATEPSPAPPRAGKSAVKPDPAPDTVRLKDGGTIRGKIIIRSETSVLIKTTEGKTVTVPVTDLEAIESR